MRYEETRHAYGHRPLCAPAPYANVLPSLHITYRSGERSTLRRRAAAVAPEYTRSPITTPPSDGLILQAIPICGHAQGVDLLFETFPGRLAW